MATHISHCFQFSFVVEANFPRNSTMITWQTENKTFILFTCGKNTRIRFRWWTRFFTWRTRVMTIIPMKRRFLITPLKMFFSSGFRALNSLKACCNQHKTKQINKHMRFTLWFGFYCKREASFNSLTWQRTKALKIIVFFTRVACAGTSCWRPSMLMPRKLRTNSTLTW